MSRHALADHGSGLNLGLRGDGSDEACKQRRGAVALVVVRAPLGLAKTHRQHRLRAVKRLNLALFIDADDQRLVRRIEIETDNVAYFLDELRIGRELERFCAMRLQAKGTPDA